MQRAIILLALLLASPAAAQDLTSPGIVQPSAGMKIMPRTYWYPYQAETGSRSGSANLARWLINDLAGQTGPGWHLIECYDGAFGAPKRRVPADPLDMDSLPAGFSWRNNAPAVGDWCVFESLAGLYGTKFEVYLEYDAVTTIKYLLMPYDAFVPGGADATPPAFPATALCSAAGTLCSFTVVNGAYRMSAIADTAMLILLSDNAGTRYWTYIGELNGAKDAGTPADTRPFVIWDTPTIFVCQANQIDFNRISPVDGSTVLTTGSFSPPVSQSTAGVQPLGAAAAATWGDPGLLGLHIAVSTVVHFTNSDVVSNHVAGSPRNLKCYNVAAGTLVQTSDLKMLGISSNATYGGLLFKWDGATTYTGAATVAFAHRGYRYIPEDYIFGGAW